MLISSPPDCRFGLKIAFDLESNKPVDIEVLAPGMDGSPRGTMLLSKLLRRTLLDLRLATGAVLLSKLLRVFRAVIFVMPRNPELLSKLRRISFLAFGIAACFELPMWG